MSQEIAYEPHPVSPERKAELRAKGFRILDIIYAPAYYTPHEVPKEIVTSEQIDKMRKADLVKRLAECGIQAPQKVGDMRAALKALLISDDRPPLGEIIGEGCFRAVFKHASDADLVVKIEKSKGANARELAAWDAIRGTEYEAHFAPIVEFGEGWLTQVRVDEYHGEAPDMIPDICSEDADRRNFGVWNGQLVCMDMGEIDPKSVGQKAKMKPASWRQ